MNATPDNNPVSVLCVEDNSHVAQAIAAKLRGSGGFEWRGQLDCADELVEHAARERPAVILLDLDMPGVNPLDAAAELVKRRPDCRVIVFSGHVTQGLFDRAVESGVWGYVSKNDGEDALIDGIRRVMAGEFAMSAEVRALAVRA